MAVPLMLMVVAATGPEIVDVLLKVPVLTTPVSAEDPLTDSVPDSDVAALAVNVLAAIGPEMVPVLDRVPVFAMPESIEDPLARKVPFMSHA